MSPSHHLVETTVGFNQRSNFVKCLGLPTVRRLLIEQLWIFLTQVLLLKVSSSLSKNKKTNELYRAHLYLVSPILTDPHKTWLSEAPF